MKQKTRYQESFDNLYSKEDILKRSIIVLLIILLLDYLNIFTKLFEIKELISIYLGIGVFIIIKIIEFKPWNLYKLETVNYIDSFLISTIICLFIYILLNIRIITDLKIVISIILTFFFSLLACIRIIRINRIQNGKVKTNIYDLKDLYDGRIKNNQELIFIKENDVDYDMLQRSNIINNLNNAITNCYTDEKFVIALEGNWGSGKTTILNNFKKILSKKDIILIDDFDPWSYKDEKSLFRGMFDSFMKKIGINFSIRSINRFLNIYMDTIFYNSKYDKHYSILKKYYSNYDETNKIREIINNYLKNNNKRILFIIDNIERAEKENIIFLFKLINNILNFQNTIYLLSFDDQIMKKIFNEDLNIDYNYLKKIIQLEIKIPEVDKSVMSDIVSKCINNMFELYKIPQIKIEDIAEISNSISDLRDLKRYLNSIITFQYKANNYLNCADVFLLEIIKKENYQLYKNIENNKKFFVSFDTHLDKNIYTLNTTDFNNSAKEFLDTLLKNEDEKYKRILAKLFPYVQNYLDGKPLKEEYSNGHLKSINKDEYNDSIINEKISNARYFDLYFFQNKNEFIQINEKVKEFISVLNNFKNIKDLKEEYIKMSLLYNNWIQKYVFEILEINMKKVNIDKKIILLKLIYENIGLYDDSILFFELSALSRVQIIMSELMMNITEDELNGFMEIMEKDKSNLYLIHELIYWIKNNNERPESKKEIINKLVNLSNNKINIIIKNKINILDDENYSEKNIWGFYHATKDNEELRKKYIKTILNEQTIFRFLNDMVGRSLGSKYGYKMVDENINAFTTRDDINSILSKISKELTDDEKMLLRLFNNDDLEEGTLYLDYDKKFKV